MLAASIAKLSTATARKAVLAALCCTGAIIVILLVALVGFEDAKRTAATRLVNAYRVADEIALADERLTMSAKMAVATGDKAWIERYKANVPFIKESIRRATKLASPRSSQEFVANTRASNDRLIELERAAFEALRAGEGAAARKLLNSSLYDHHKRILEEGTRAFVSSMVTAERNRLESIEWWIWGAIPLALFIWGACALLLWRRLTASLSRSELAFAQAEADIRQLAKTNALAAETLAAQKVQLDTALDNMGRGLSMFDAEGRLIVCNRCYREFYGLPEELVRPGTPLADIIRHHVKRETGHVTEENIEDQGKWIEEHFGALARGKSFSHAQQLKNGRTILVTNQPLAEGGWVDVQEDITDRLRFEAKIAHLAHHDALTDLPNRMQLRRRLEEALSRLRPGEQLAFHLLDLDGFKPINDMFGHPVGDELLKSVPERVRGLLRETDTIARMGGDEFAIIQVGTEDDQAVTRLARRLIDVVSAPYDIDDCQLKVGASIGIALAPADGDTPEKLMRSAELALYQAKATGRGTYCFYNEEINARVHRRQRLGADLREALGTDAFELHYQPIVSLEQSQIVGAEALMRWHHPKEGMLSPKEFIPVAEETGLIIPLGEWAIREACAQAKSWPNHVRVAVNLSPVQFKRSGLFKVIASALAASGLLANRLELEITESILLDEDPNLTTLHKLRELGVQIALDDFGTGYSSLSYLHTLPFNKIKIDQSFIKGLTTKHESRKIVRAIVTLARSLGIRTTAEGVETREQLDAVRFEGCDEIQGYLIGPPQPAGDILRLTRSSITMVRRAKRNSQVGRQARKASPETTRRGG
jgi:diguanylate cyclase (GGDEF)-like protein